MDTSYVAVNTYQLTGSGMEITFSRENPDELEFVYRDALGERRFSGREIYRDNVMWGFIASVILEAAPDLHTVSLALAVPAANRDPDAKSVPVKTFAVRTTSRTSIAGPDMVEGQLQVYETYPLEGNAW